jgi:AraC-like DNA-binding protein
MSFSYREWTPIPELAGLVEAIWSLRCDDPLPPADPQRILPDGCSELILNFADPVEQVLSSGRTVRQPPIVFVGQLPSPLYIRPTGRLDQVGIRFRPAGAAGFMREPQSRLLGIGVSLHDLAPKLARALAGAAFDATSADARIATIQTGLAAAVRRSPTPIGRLADRVVRSWGAAPIDDLVHDIGLSARQLGRRFQLEVGLRPKLLARICRFQRIFHALESHPAHWAQVAADCGYFDSSHLIRDVRELAGETPSRLIEESDRLTGLFTRAQRIRR